MLESLVGISGLMGSGKDEVARVLVDEFGYTRVGFADALRAELRTFLPRTLTALANLAYDGVPLDQAARVERALRDKPYGVRELLQEWGTEVRRAQDPDYWVSAWRTQISDLSRVVTPDCRFLNEIQAIRRLGGRHWRVVRVGVQSQTSDHSSEHGLAGVPADVVIVNDRGRQDLREAVRQLARRLVRSRDENEP